MAGLWLRESPSPFVPEGLEPRQQKPQLAELAPGRAAPLAVRRCGRLPTAGSVSTRLWCHLGAGAGTARTGRLSQTLVGIGLVKRP